MGRITKNKLLEQLSPMYNVIIEPAKCGKSYVVKDDVRFGFVKDKNLYLLNESGDFVQLMDNDNNPDQLLLEATKSFWHARSQKYEEA